MKSARFQTLGTNKKVIIVHPQTRYWSPVERTLKLFLNFFLQEKFQTQETGRPFVPVPFFVFLRGRFCKFFWFNRTSKIGAVEDVSLSLFRHPFLHTLFNSHFTLINNEKLFNSRPSPTEITSFSYPEDLQQTCVY
jgi:hypothetical protein